MTTIVFSNGCGGGSNPVSSGTTDTTGGSDIPKDIIRISGRQLVVGENDDVIRLRGVLFHSDWWADRDFIINQSLDHTELDYQRVAAMGMNAIRFGITYKLLEDDSNPGVYSQDGWDWLDTEISYAEKNGIYFVLDMHKPQGGFQECKEEGKALWSDEVLQSRLKALWKAIAQRYKDEPVIAAYDLVNEPCPPDGQQDWEDLAQELIDEIRTVDTNHIIIVEESLNGELFMVDDDNIMYDVHMYEPNQYAFQYGWSHGDGGVYPDLLVGVNPWDIHYSNDEVYRLDTGSVPAGDSDWTLYESAVYKVPDDTIIVAAPVLVSEANSGTVYYDDFTIYEYDESMQLVREQYIDIENPGASQEGWQLNLDLESTGVYHYPTENWYNLSKEGYASGVLGTIAAAQGSAHQGSYSISIAGATDDMHLSSYGLNFEVKTGYSYKISGWMKGASVDGQAGRMSLAFYELPDDEVRRPFNKDFLEYRMLKKMVNFAVANNVPLNAGEFGLVTRCFSSGLGGVSTNRGGLAWVRDMVELFDKYEISYQYAFYHIVDMGIYYNYNSLPDPAYANQELIDLFTELHSAE